ncbi:MAG TPA: hypothetical protein VG841_03925 [Caulobacterales bacterium]|nr:hypothetical protein [Caulobacterales bacterium]
MNYANTAYIDQRTRRVAEIVPASEGEQPDRPGFWRELCSEQVEVGCEYLPDERTFAGIEGELVYQLS